MAKLFVFGFALFATLAPAWAQSYSNIALGDYSDLHGWRPFPGSFWNTPVTNAPISPNSAAWAAASGSLHLHPDFTMPYQVVSSLSTRFVIPKCATNGYCDESDPVAVPLPENPLIESAPAECAGNGDNHAIFIDQHTGYLFEFYHFNYCKGTYNYDSSVLWDTTINQTRTYGITSVDAAGLSVFAGLVKYDEATTNTVPQKLPNGATVQTLGHAIRFTMQQTKCANIGHGWEGVFVSPATHAACNVGGTPNIMGMRIRLKPNFDTTGLTGASLVIANTMKTYGMVLADNGGYAFFTGTADPRWTEDDQNQLKKVQLSSFDVIDYGELYSASSHPGGKAPSAAQLSADTKSLVSGKSFVLSWTSSNSDMDFIANGPPSRVKAARVSPRSTGTYSVITTNAFGRTVSHPLKVEVSPAPAGAPAK